MKSLKNVYLFGQSGTYYWTNRYFLYLRKVKWLRKGRHRNGNHFMENLKYLPLKISENFKWYLCKLHNWDFFLLTGYLLVECFIGGKWVAPVDEDDLFAQSNINMNVVIVKQKYVKKSKQSWWIRQVGKQLSLCSIRYIRKIHIKQRLWWGTKSFAWFIIRYSEALLLAKLKFNGKVQLNLGITESCCGKFMPGRMLRGQINKGIYLPKAGSVSRFLSLWIIIFDFDGRKVMVDDV